MLEMHVIRDSCRRFVLGEFRIIGVFGKEPGHASDVETSYTYRGSLRPQYGVKGSTARPRPVSFDVR